MADLLLAYRGRTAHAVKDTPDGPGQGGRAISLCGLEVTIDGYLGCVFPWRPVYGCDDCREATT